MGIVHHITDNMQLFSNYKIDSTASVNIIYIITNTYYKNILYTRIPNMFYRLVCILIFTNRMMPDYTNLRSPYITIADKIIDTVHTYYLNEYFNRILQNQYEKLIIATSIAYDSCNKYSGKKINGTNDFFKYKIKDVETYISKMFSTFDNSSFVSYKPAPFDTVDLYYGTNLRNEETLLKSYTFDKCMVYNYNYDKCSINVA